MQTSEYSLVPSILINIQSTVSQIQELPNSALGCQHVEGWVVFPEEGNSSS